MDPEKRIVTRLPLTELWTDSGSLKGVRGASIGKDTIIQFLREGRVRFVVADVGNKLQWIPEIECFDFWKKEVSPHLAEPETQIQLEQFPSNYCFWASEWQADDEHRIVVLEKAH